MGRRLPRVSYGHRQIPALGPNTESWAESVAGRGHFSVRSALAGGVRDNAEPMTGLLAEAEDLERRMAEVVERLTGTFSAIRNDRPAGAATVTVPGAATAKVPPPAPPGLGAGGVAADFDCDRDDEELLRRTFTILDPGGRGAVAPDALDRAARDHPDHADLVAALRGGLLSSPAGAGDADFSAFRRAVDQTPRARGHRVQWAGSLGLGAALARHLPAGDLFDPLGGIRAMGDAALSTACAAFAADVERLVRAGRDALVRGGGAVEGGSEAERTNRKFGEEAGATAASYASLDDFYLGPEGLLGLPNPRLRVGMEREHCLRGSAGGMVVTPNYGLCTRSEWEWHWCVDADGPRLPADLRARLAGRSGKYPGEVGDTLAETVVRLRVTAASEAAAAGLARTVEGELRQALGGAGGLLEEGEARARGLSVVQSAAATGAVVELAVALPLELAAVEASRSKVHAALAAASGIPAGRVEVVECLAREWAYCAFTEERALAAALVSMPLRALEAAVDACSESAQTSDAVELCRLVGEARRLLVVLMERDAAAADAEGKSARGAHGDDFVVSQGAVEEGATRGAEASSAALREIICLAFDEQTRQWRAGNRIRRQGRTRQGRLADFIDKLKASKEGREKLLAASLQEDEILSLNLYTGPLYVLYNAVLRGFPRNLVDLLNTGYESEKNAGTGRAVYGNRFETTIFVISSGITKLAKHTKVLQLAHNDSHGPA
jgi:hypothetical protein